jgi:hypothetical protein
MPSKNSGCTVTSWTTRSVVAIPSRCSRSSSTSSSPSMRSSGGAPSRVASARAAGVKLPVVMSSPFSPQPIIAPRKSLTWEAPTVPKYRLHWKKTGKDTSDIR